MLLDSNFEIFYKLGQLQILFPKFVGISIYPCEFIWILHLGELDRFGNRNRTIAVDNSSVVARDPLHGGFSVIQDFCKLALE